MGFLHLLVLTIVCWEFLSNVNWDQMWRSIGSHGMWWISVAHNTFLTMIWVVNNWSILWTVDSRLHLLETKLKDDCRLISLCNLWGVYKELCMTKTELISLHYLWMRIFPRMISVSGLELGYFPGLVSSVAMSVTGHFSTFCSDWHLIVMCRKCKCCTKTLQCLLCHRRRWNCPYALK